MALSKNRRTLESPNELTFLGQQLRGYLAGGPVEVSWRRPEPTRTVEQNDRMWAMLGDVSRQVVWYGKNLQPHEWKDVFSATIKKQEAVPGIDGGFVIIGQRTSKMGVRMMSQMIELIMFFGDERQVAWSDPKIVSQQEAA